MKKYLTITKYKFHFCFNFKRIDLLSDRSCKDWPLLDWEWVKEFSDKRFFIEDFVRNESMIAIHTSPLCFFIIFVASKK